MTRWVLPLAALLVSRFCGSSFADETRQKSAQSGVPLGLFAVGQIDELTCKTDPNSLLQPTVTKPPLHGSLSVRRVSVPFHSIAGAHVCNGRPMDASALVYTSAKGYRGPDRVEIMTTSYSGRMERTDALVYQIDVR